MKINIFGFLKTLLGKRQGPTPAIEPAAEAVPPSNSISSFEPAPVRKTHGVEVSLQKVLASLPVELQPRIRQANVGQQSIAVRLEKILPQLAKGTVKLTFGELRQNAPGVFSGEKDQDQVLVPLPLGDILSQLNPAFITRRRTQRQVEVPTDISSPFEVSSPGSVSEASGAGETNPTAPVLPAREVSPIPLKPAAPEHGSLNSVPASTQPTKPLDTTPQPSAVKPATVAEPLLLAIGALAEGWPDVVRKEILGLGLAEARVAIPAEAVEHALKQGKIAFTWKTICSWIVPSAPARVSPNDNCMLELPLKLVVPLLLERQRKASKAKQEVSMEEETPKPVSGLLRETDAPLGACEAWPSDTADSAWNGTQETLRAHKPEMKKATEATKVVVKCPTPNDIVSRATALDGVAGALFALPDGLMVANRLPTNLNGESLAAFLPQIFGKVSQCTKEYRMMGELNDLNFTLGNIPWKIVRGRATFFGAFGREGEALPAAQLTALAAELEHNAK